MGLLKSAIRSALNPDALSQNTYRPGQPAVNKPSYYDAGNYDTPHNPGQWPQPGSNQRVPNDHNVYVPSQMQQDIYYQPQEAPPSYSSGFRPVVLPQIAFGDGAPFLRGYSTELRRFGLEEQDFIQAVDLVNTVVVPNPENQIFQKAAGLAGWFVPGSAGLALMAGQLAVGGGNMYSHSTSVKSALAQINQQLFHPHGLEIYIGKTEDLTRELGLFPQSAPRPSLDAAHPLQRLAVYGNMIAPVDRTLPPLEASGRTDPIAMLGRGLGSREAKKKLEKAREDEAEGKAKKADRLHKSLQWLIVRRC